MFKFIIILIIIIFVFGKLFKLLFKYAIIGAMHKHAYESTSQRHKEGSINVKSDPKKSNDKKTPGSGGEYIDYEIVK